MIGRLLGGLGAMLLYFCVGTVIAEAIILGYALSKWHIDRPRLVQMMAVAQGVDLAPPQAAPSAPRKEEASEQPTFDQLVEARAAKVRDVELREQALKSGTDQLRFEQSKLADDKLAFQRTRTAFESNLAAVQKQAADGGWDESRRVLLAAKPKTAKDLILLMLEKKELDAVVALMTPMPDTRRSKIIAEFKTPEEIKKIDEILREIRRGDPLTGITANTRQQLDQNNPSAPQGGP